MRYLMFSLLCVFTLSLLPATSYYLDATGGNDANDGLTPATAWQNLQRLRSPAIAISAGDTVRLKRGERWTKQLYIDYASTAANPVVFMAYGDPLAPLPVITSQDEIPNADDSADWTEISPGIWSMRIFRTPGRLLLDDVEVLRSSVLDSLGMNDSEGAFGKWFWNQPDSTLRIAASGNPALVYGSIKGSLQFYSTLVVLGGNFVFENIDFQGGWGSSLAIFASNDITIRNCNLGRYGNTGLLVSGAEVNQSFLPTSGIIIEQNIFDSGFTFFYGIGSERGCGDGVRLINDVSNSRITQNYFLNWAHNAVELRGDIAGAAGVNNNLIEGNIITAPDIPYAHPMSADGFAGKCQFNRFTANFIENCRTACQINGNDNIVDHNILRSMRRSPSKLAPTAHAITVAVYGTGLVSRDNVFDHNLIMDTDESAFLVINYGYPETVTGHKFRNNICYNTGQAPFEDRYPPGTGFFIDEEGVSGNNFQNNLFFDESVAVTAAYISSTGESLIVDAFNARNGVNGDVVEGNITGDPLFTDLLTGNYLPLEASPLIDAGLDLGYTTDYLMADRLQGTAPDIGPLETVFSRPLPLRLGAFTVSKTGKSEVTLFWRTLSEAGTADFIVERNQGAGWEDIGRVAAAGEAATITDYKFQDRLAPGGDLLYRLRQTDLDGSFSYSPVRSISLPSASISLNWLSWRQAEIMLPEGAMAARLEVSLFASNGSNVSVELTGTRCRFAEHLPAGLYLLNVNGEAIKFFLW